MKDSKCDSFIGTYTEIILKCLEVMGRYAGQTSFEITSAIVAG